MLQCLCGRSLRTSNSLSGETRVPSLALKHPLSPPDLSPFPSAPRFLGVGGGGRKAFPWWDQMTPQRVVFFFFLSPEVISALSNALAVTCARPRASGLSGGALGDLLRTASRLSPCDLRGRRVAGSCPVSPPRSCQCAGRERGLGNRWPARQVSFLFLALSGKETPGHLWGVRFALEIKQVLREQESSY